MSMERFSACREDTGDVYTSSCDVANALIASLEYCQGFAAFMISSDRNQTHINLSKARRLLNWEPQVD